MAHFKDLAPLEYHSGPLSSKEWKCQLLAVGWLEKGFDFNKGSVPKWLIANIGNLRTATKERLSQWTFRGLHSCSLSEDENVLIGSNVNLFVPGSGCVYVAPGRIDHYIRHHNYLPPESFIDAVAKCPDPSSIEYMKALTDINSQILPPLFDRI